MQASLFLVNDAKYVQESYRKEYLKSYASAFITRVKKISGKEVKNDTDIDTSKVKEAITLLIEQEDSATGEKNGLTRYFSRYIK